MNSPAYYEAEAATHRTAATEATSHEDACKHLELACLNSGLAVSAGYQR